jgi:hypothetical protein
VALWRFLRPLHSDGVVSFQESAAITGATLPLSDAEEARKGRTRWFDACTSHALWASSYDRYGASAGIELGSRVTLAPWAAGAELGLCRDPRLPVRVLELLDLTGLSCWTSA